MFSIDDANQEWREETTRALRQFAEQHRQVLRDADRAARFDRDIYRAMGEHGWVGVMAPVEFGGQGLGAAAYCHIVEEVRRFGLITPQISVQGQRWLVDWGTEYQKQRYLRGIASGEIVFSESISEPTMGSSFKDMQATARRDGDEWVLNGSKTHVNLGADCDVTLFYGLAEQGVTAFFVDMDTPGVSAVQTDPIGLRHVPTADVQFQEVRVADGAVLGEVGRGLDTFLSTFNLSRLGNASELIGLARRALTDALEYARSRTVAGTSVADFQGLQWIVADCYSALYGAALARDLAVRAADAGEDHALETTVAKKLAIDASDMTANQVFALAGGHALYFDEDYAAILNDVKVLRTAGGSLEVLRNYIARRVIRDRAGGLE